MINTLLLGAYTLLSLMLSSSLSFAATHQHEFMNINGQRWSLTPTGSVYDYGCAAQDWLENIYNPLAQLLCREATHAAWNYSTTLSADAANHMVERERQQKLITDRLHHVARYFNLSRLNTTTTPLNEQVVRQIQLLQRADTFGLSAAQERQLGELMKRMRVIYDNVSVCRSEIFEGDENKNKNEDNKNCTSGTLDARELNEIMSTSHDERVLERVWTSFRRATGDRIRPLFYDAAMLLNRRAQLNNHSDYGAVWRLLYTSDTYTDANFLDNIATLWQRQMRPVYEQLHAYVRKKLAQTYPQAIQAAADGSAIPVHLLNNMWGQSWEHLYSLPSAPFPHVAAPDLNAHMRERNFTGRDIIRLADEFFIGLGFDPLPQAFYEESVFEKSKDNTTNMQCHAAAYDMCDGSARLLMCMKGVVEELYIAFHELGHIQFYYQSRHLPYLLRSRANPGLHEAIGDSISLSARSPGNLARLGLIERSAFTREHDLNNLYAMALDKLAFLPFSLIVDYWRWAVFNGSVPPHELNREWWRLRYEYQGVEPPHERGEEHLDAAAKFHVAYGQPYVRYFIAALVQFQLYEAFCRAAGQYGTIDGAEQPLHHCDIAGSEAAGELLRRLMRQGGSQDWQELLREATGSARLDACPMIRYFQPLLEWIAKDNEETKEFIGWRRRLPVRRKKYVEDDDEFENNDGEDEDLFAEKNINNFFEATTSTLPPTLTENDGRSNNDDASNKALLYQVIAECQQAAAANSAAVISAKTNFVTVLLVLLGTCALLFF